MLFGRLAVWAFIALALPGCTTPRAATQAQPAIAEDTRILPYVQPDKLVNIGGRRIHLHCSGSEQGPTVVILSGIGSWSPVWYKVQPEIAKSAHVCAFDRAGYGFSDPAPKPQILSNPVDDLHAALHAGSIPGPYVLVGHSLGGVEARLYTQRWSDEVVGMVLVDTSPAGEGLINEQQPGFDEVMGREYYASNKLHCALLAANGPLSPSSPDYTVCSLPLPRDTPAAFRKIWPRFFTAYLAATQVSLMSSLYTHQYDSVDHNSLGAMPLVVLSAENSWRASWNENNPAFRQFSQSYGPIWIGMHRSLALLSSRGVHTVVPGSDHDIQLNNPQAVIDAVDKVLRQLKQD